MFCFESTQHCSVCNCYFNSVTGDELCPRCRENELFSRVRDFIDATHPTVAEVANQFNIPKSRVKRWINEDRIQYIENSGYTGKWCSICGKPVLSGNICFECARETMPKETLKVITEDAKFRSRLGK